MANRLDIVTTKKLDKRGVFVRLKTKTETKDIEIRVGEDGKIFILSNFPISTIISKELGYGDEI